MIEEMLMATLEYWEQFKIWAYTHPYLFLISFGISLALLFMVLYGSFAPKHPRQPDRPPKRIIYEY